MILLVHVPVHRLGMVYLLAAVFWSTVRLVIALCNVLFVLFSTISSFMCVGAIFFFFFPFFFFPSFFSPYDWMSDSMCTRAAS